MAPPILMGVTKEEKENAGYSSFGERIEDPQSVYIGGNVQKYAHSHIPSLWVNPFYGYYHGEEANKLFESFIRNNDVLKQCLLQLKDKIIGCWCTTGCHGEVLIKLYKEFVRENDVLFK